MKTIIIKPIISEKATNFEKSFIYSFWVNKKATKIEIKNAVKKTYGVEVASVKIINTPAKTKMVRRLTVNKRSPMKKAFVTLKGRKKIDITKLDKKEKKEETDK